MNNPDDIIKDPEASLEEKAKAYYDRSFARYNLGKYEEAIGQLQ